MLACYSKDRDSTIPIYPLQASQLESWLAQQPARWQEWVRANKFKAESGSLCRLPAEDGRLAAVLFGINNLDDFWIYGSLPISLPEGHYRLELEDPSSEQWQRILMAWGLGAYQFSLYREANLPRSTLFVPPSCDYSELEILVSSIYLLRDLINTPAEAMGPAELSEAALKVADEFGANVKLIVGDELLKENYPLIHAVGRASSEAPRLIDLRWGDEKNPRVTLVGKGVCYDTGGLSIKTTAGMLLMKK
ncbi:MAG TPA: leucyl aminopeptidase family protein, partial [Coxiellaceae bacterium]|nr:leucyl aminopeptidase family protein [Coxiellaceae bacterium]